MSAVVKRAIAMHLAKQHRLRQTRRPLPIPEAPMPDTEPTLEATATTPEYLSSFRLTGETCAWTYTLGYRVNSPIR